MPGVLSHSRRAGHLGGRFESAEAARDLVVLLVLLLRSALDALDATLRDVRTEFLAICVTSFLAGQKHQWRRMEEKHCTDILPNFPVAVNKLNR